MAIGLAGVAVEGAGEAGGEDEEAVGGVAFAVDDRSGVFGQQVELADGARQLVLRELVEDRGPMKVGSGSGLLDPIALELGGRFRFGMLPCLREALIAVEASASGETPGVCRPTPGI